MSCPPAKNGLPHRRWVRWGVIAYLIALHLALGLALYRFGLPLSVRVQLGLASPNAPFYQAMLFFQNTVDATLPDNTTVFLGDSITQGLAVTAIEPSSANYGISGQTTRQMLDALSTYQALPRAKAIVLTIGINDFLRQEQAGIEQRLAQIAQALPAKVPLIWNAVMPVAPGLVDAPALIGTNQAIQRLCAQRAHCTFVDTWPILSDSAGRIHAAYYVPDGVHLSPDGYRAWITALKPYAQFQPYPK